MVGLSCVEKGMDVGLGVRAIRVGGIGWYGIASNCGSFGRARKGLNSACDETSKGLKGEARTGPICDYVSGMIGESCDSWVFW